jgi:hypothetical protein
MGIIGKSFAFVMLPLSIIIFLDSIKLYTLNLPFDKVFVAALLMIALQIISFVMSYVTHRGVKFVEIITLVAFSLPAIAYIGSTLAAFDLPSYVPVVLSVLMFVESLYALH